MVQKLVQNHGTKRTVGDDFYKKEKAMETITYATTVQRASSVMIDMVSIHVTPVGISKVCPPLG